MIAELTGERSAELDIVCVDIARGRLCWLLRNGWARFYNPS